MRYKQRGLRGTEGFTIIEIVIATCVLTLVIGTSLTVLGRGFATLDSARCFSTASQIMQSELEHMRLTDWGNGTSGAGSGTTGVTAYSKSRTPLTIDADHYAGSVGARMKLYRTAGDVHELAPNDRIIWIKLEIEWTSHDGQPLSRSYTTYYGYKGLYDFFSI
jgi:hypothetical protein